MANDQLALRNQEPMKSAPGGPAAPSGKPNSLGGAVPNEPTPNPDNWKLDAGQGATQDTTATSVTKAPVRAMAVGEDDEENKDKEAVKEDDLDLDDLGLDIDFDNDVDDFEVTNEPVGEPYDPNAPFEFESDEEDKDKEAVKEDDDADDDKDAVTEGEHDADCKCVGCQNKANEDTDMGIDHPALGEEDDDDKKDNPFVKEGDEDDDDKPAVAEDDDEDDDKKAVSEDDDEDKDKEAVAESRVKIRMSVKKDVQALMAADTTLSESFKSKAAVIFETALKSKIAGVSKALNEAYAKKVKANRRLTEQKLTKQVDRFINHIVEEWMKENTVAIETGLRAELVDDFMVGLKRLFQEHYIDVPQSKVNVVESLNKRCEALEAQVNKSERERVRLKEEIAKRDRQLIEARVLDTIAVSERVKVQKLAEQVTFESATQYEAALKTLVESYTAKPVTKPVKQAAEPNQKNFLKEEKTVKGTAEVPEMPAIADAVKRVMRGNK